MIATKYPLLKIVLGCAFAVVLFGGCRDQGPQRVLVSGNVTYNGEPVAEGVIRFTPGEDSPMPMTAAAIINGAYKADLRGGVPVGTHKVEIEAYRMAEKSATQMLRGSPPRIQYLPDRYNTKSELQITVESGSEDIIKDFALTK